MEAGGSVRDVMTEEEVGVTQGREPGNRSDLSELEKAGKWFSPRASRKNVALLTLFRLPASRAVR